MAAAPQETTFSTYNKAQGQHYAQIRPDYHPSVYDLVVQQHAATGGGFDTLVDLGCGPGMVARRLGPRFQHVYGVDPAPGMVATARELGGVTSSGQPIRFVPGTADSFGSQATRDGADDDDAVLGDGSVDLITAANAAHWFDMQRFWQRADAVLRPGGSVALWTSGSLRVHPDSAAADKVQEVMDQYERDLEPYINDGNRLVMDQYRGLVLPWTAPEPVAAFDEASFFRREWTTDEPFMTSSNVPVNVNLLEKVMSTASPYTRWCEAHPDDARTERNILHKLCLHVESILSEAGIDKSEQTVRGMALGAVLIVKKKLA